MTTTLKIRKPPADGGYFVLGTDPLKLRDPNSDSLIDLSVANVRVRNQANDGWIEFEPYIESIETASAFTDILDVSTDPRHVNLSDGRAYGLWFDAGLHPYRGSDGKTYLTVGNWTSYRFCVEDDNWADGSGWTSLNDPVWASHNTGVQSEYDHRIWLFGHHAIGADIYSVCHHEWFNQRETIDGIPGWNVNPAHEHCTSTILMKSTNNGASFSDPDGTTAATRLILTPEPWAVQSAETLYGFRHPSNVPKKEGDYWYSAIDTFYLPAGDAAKISCGFVLIRTNDLSNNQGWEYWNGAGWTTRSILTYQGNLSTQQPHLFFRVDGYDPFTTSARNNRMAQTIRWHTPTSQWLIFGFSGMNPAGPLVWSASKTLANPQFETFGRRTISLAGGGVNSDYNTYIGVFDPSATDQNFSDIGNSPKLIVSDDYSRLKIQDLQINVL